MQNFKLNGIDAVFDGTDDTVSFKFEQLEVNVGYFSEENSFDLMIMDGTESEVYPQTLINGLVKEKDLEEDWPVAIGVGKTDDLLAAINKALSLLSPSCTKEAYKGM